MFSIIGGRLSLRGQTALFYFAFTTPGEVRSTISDIPNQRPHFKLTTVVSGFAKPVNGKYAPNINNGQMKVGEDAYWDYIKIESAVDPSISEMRHFLMVHTTTEMY